MVFAGREEVGWGFDFCDVDGGFVHGDAAGVFEEIVAVHFA